MTNKPVTDRASYRNRGGIWQRLVTAYKSWRFLTRAGRDLVIKPSAEFRLAKDAVLEIGDGSTVQDYSFFQLTLPHPKVFIGRSSVIGRRNIITAKNLIRIGNNVLLGSDVQIIDHSHGIARDRPIRDQAAIVGEVVIGDDVWVGAGAKILMDVHIGTGAVIGVNSVVTRDVPEYAVAVGVPARVVKLRS